MKSNFNPIFVFGCRRSGTTLMLNCLNHHPDVGLFPGETHYFQRHLGGYKKRGKSPPLQQSKYTLALFRDALKYQKKYLLEMDLYQDYFLVDLWFAKVAGHDIINAKEAYKKAIAELPDNGYYEKQFFENFLMEIAQQQHAKYYGEKSPMHIFYLDTLREWFPNACFIQLIRDPRSTACSHVYREMRNSKYNINPKVAFFHPTFTRLIKRWQETSQIGIQNEGKEDYFIIKFEDLLEKPEETLQKLPIPFDKRMMDIDVYHSSYSDKKKGFDKSRTETWKRNAPHIINWYIEKKCKKEMEHFGYE